METPPNPQVHDLGLVASALDRIRLAQTVDRLVGPRPGEKVSTGMALKAAILNALGEWALRRRLDETGSSLPDQKGRPLPKDPPCARSSSSSSGCVWPGWTTDPWSSTWPPITRRQPVCWRWSDITSWSEGGAECGRSLAGSQKSIQQKGHCCQAATQPALQAEAPSGEAMRPQPPPFQPVRHKCTASLQAQPPPTCPKRLPLFPAG